MITITCYVYVWDYGNKYFRGLTYRSPIHRNNKMNIKQSTNYNYKSTKVSPTRIVITEKHIEVYDSEGKLRVRINKD